ncbi:putative glycosyltransferase family 20 protein [Paratrimastix pyriformis]|uniref:Trehalose 6-phosphate phosphatase n=1 Tax=Paratrimastix pyriformis TaxID=342808 RepID=A0ABQ8UKJ3_9EUKA|nr:putative glycosyltransferase family 20 protein [Paratrimastix pyriformis]
MRILLFDYDGTLAPLVSDTAKVPPSADLMKNLVRLSTHKNTFVYIVSGRDRNNLQELFANPAIGIVAEHGMVVRHPHTTQLEPYFASPPDLSWLPRVHQTMADISAQAPGSRVESKPSGLCFHYRRCCGDTGEHSAQEIRTALERDGTLMAGVEVISGNKVVEARCRGVNKGAMVSRILDKFLLPGEHPHPPNSDHPQDGTSDRTPSFVLCMGDDRTDEDMFAVCNHLSPLAASCSTVIVGPRRPTLARHSLAGCAEALQLVSLLAAVTD